MLFNVLISLSANPRTEMILISGNSLLNCVQYLENNQKKVTNITESKEVLILNDSGATHCYLVNLRDVDTNTVFSYTIFDTFNNISSWINSQEDKYPLTISRQNKTFIII